MPDPVNNPAQDKPRVPRGKGARGLATIDFPPRMRTELDKLIVDGANASKLLQHIVQYYPEVKSPSIETLYRYVRKRVTEIENDANLQMQIARAQRDVSLMDIDKNDPAIIEGLLDVHFQTIDAAKWRRRHGKGDFKIDATITEASAMVAKLLETRMKLEQHGRAQEHRMKATVDILNKYLIIGTMKAYRAIHGDKKEKEFALELRACLKNLDTDAIEAELLDVMTNTKGKGRLSANSAG